MNIKNTPQYREYRHALLTWASWAFTRDRAIINHMDRRLAQARSDWDKFMKDEIDYRTRARLIIERAKGEL